MNVSVVKSCLSCLIGAAALTAAGSQSALACEAHAANGQSLQTAQAQGHAMSSVMAMDAWVPVAPPGVKAHAAYMVLMNHGKETRTITAVQSPQYGSATMHASITKDGVTHMQHRAAVDLPPGPPVGFVPGGMHIMLMKPKAAYKEGDTIDLSLTLDDGTTVAVKATVRARNDAPGMNHDHMNHGAMGHDHKGS